MKKDLQLKGPDGKDFVERNVGRRCFTMAVDNGKWDWRTFHGFHAALRRVTSSCNPLTATNPVPDPRI